MKTFTFLAIDAKGQKTRSTIEANNIDEVATILQQQGYFIEKIQEGKNFDFNDLLKFEIGGYSMNDKIIVLKQFGIMSQAGIPITKIIESIAENVKSTKMKSALNAVLKDIQNGGSLADAFEKQKGIFSEVQLSLLRAGEKSGNITEMIEKISYDLERNKNFISKIRGAMIYPSIVFVAVLAVVYVLMTVMIPSIKSLFAQLGKEGQIPGITQVIIDIANFINPTTGIGTYILVFGIILGIIFWRSYRKQSSGLLVTDKFKRRIPIFGELSHKLDIAQFCRILSMLLSSGVEITEAVRITSKAVSNYETQLAIEEINIDLQKGYEMNSTMQRYPQVFDNILTQMVATGERSGKLDVVLSDIAKFYETEVENMSANLSKLMEPIVLVVVGLIVALLAVAVYLPIFSISSSFDTAGTDQQITQ